MDIREFKKDDYESILYVHNSIYPDYKDSLEERRHQDKIDFKNASLHRWVAEEDGDVIASCQYLYGLWDYHPKKFNFIIEVLPEHRGKGFGGRMFRFIFNRLMEEGVSSIFCWFKDDYPKNKEFLEKRGFTERHREAFSRLDLDKWEYEPSLDRGDELRNKGIDIKSLAELGKVDDW